MNADILDTAAELQQHMIEQALATRLRKNASSTLVTNYLPLFTIALCVRSCYV